MTNRSDCAASSFVIRHFHPRHQSTTDRPLGSTLNPHLSTSRHSLATWLTLAHRFPPERCAKTLLYQPGCLPVYFTSTCVDMSPISTRYATMRFLRVYRGENLFEAEKLGRFPHEALRDFDHSGKNKPMRGCRSCGGKAGEVCHLARESAARWCGAHAALPQAS